MWIFESEAMMMNMTQTQNVTELPVKLFAWAQGFPKEDWKLKALAVTYTSS